MNSANLSLSVAERVDAACDRFEQEWRAGRRPRIDDYLAAAPAGDRPELRRQLLALELELSGKGAADTSVTRSSVRTDTDADRTVLRPPTPDDPPPAAIGRFEVRGVLGHGAFGRVYRAFDPHLGREVAVKVPLDAAVATPADRARFLTEARAAATINHPNVCQVHEVGEHAGRPYIVMALVPGQSLADTLKGRKEPMAEKQAGLVVRKIALALAAAHEKGVVHRDLKPANVMFDRERKDVIVMDFGLARGPRPADARGTQSGVVMGTPAYMSPEQASGGSKDVGPAADIYSLGVMLYELLTGTRPFAGTATEVIGQILHVEPDKPSVRRAGIDPRLEAVCLKAMAKRPGERFASMKELAAALDAALRTPKPEGGSAETAKAEATRRDPAESGHMAEVFAVMSAERMATAAAVEAAVRRHRTPPWVFVLVGLVLLFGFAAVAGVIFFTRSKTTSVDLTVVLKDVDLADQSLSFFLDDEPISAEALVKPVELKPGDHVFTVKRNKEIIKRVLISVADGKKPGIEVQDITPPPAEPSPTAKPAADDDLARWQGTWDCVACDIDLGTITAEELKAKGNFQLIEKSGMQRKVTDRVYRSNFRLDATKSPKHYDSDFAEMAHPGGPFQHSGIYELDGDKLRIVFRYKPMGQAVERATWEDRGKKGVVYLEYTRRLGNDGFKSLFNGKDLTGWKGPDGEPLRWKVEDGLLTCGPGGKAQRLLSDRGDYGDVTLRVECKYSEGSSAIGAKVGADEQSKGAYRASIGNNPALGRTGSLLQPGGRFTPVVDVGKEVVGPDTWFVLELTVRGGHCTAAVNGIITAEWDDPNPPRPTGHLALTAGLSARLWIRKVEVKELTDGFVPLFNGEDLTGWKSTAGAAHKWQVADGGVTCTGGTDYLYTDRDDYDDFHLRFEAKVNDTGNGGVYFRTPKPAVVYTGSDGHYEAQLSTRADQQKTGSLLGLVKVADTPVPPDTWCTYEVIAVGDRVRLLVNGKQTADYTDTRADRPRRGHIALQCWRHGTDRTVVAYRNVEVKELKFVPLFNGKDLTGWDGLPGAWRLDNGSLVGSLPATRDKNTALASTKKYRDFELKFQVKLHKGTGNSGVQIRSTPGDKVPYQVLGPQVEVDAARGHGGLYWEGGGKWMKQAAEGVVRRVYKPAEFNDYFVRVVGKRVKVVVNGETLVDDDFPDLPEEGVIGFQLHAGARDDVTFREVLIRDLTTAEMGFVPIFNGKDLTGWTPESGDSENWKVRDGAITGIAEDATPKSGAETWLLSDKEYQDFLLRFEFRTLTEKVNSGFGYRAVPREKPGTYPVPTHLQLELFDKGVNRTGNLIGSVGPLVTIEAVPGDKQKPKGEWNQVEVEARGQSIRVKLNGQDLVNDSLDTLIAKGGLFPGLKRKRGRIGFQRLRGEIQFRNVQLKELDDVFTSLFNGKDLAGWKTHPDQPGEWAVKGGVLTGSMAVSHLYSERGDYTDFHLKMEIRATGANTGMMYRSPFGATLGVKKEWVAGYNAKFDEKRRGGIIVDTDPALHRSREVGVKDGEWATFEVIAQGNRHVVKVNGETTADYTDPEPRYRSGHIVLQQHNATPAEFRNIQVKDLSQK